MGLFGVVFIFVTFGYIAWEQRSRLVQKDQDDTRRNAFFLADHAARLFEVADLSLEQTTALVQDESWYTIEPSRILWEQIRAITNALPYVEDIWLTDANGRLRMTSAAFPPPAVNGPHQTSEASGTLIEARKGLSVGLPFIDPIKNQPTFTISRRLQYPNGSFRGVLSVSMSLSYFNTYWQQLQLPRGGRITLVREADSAILAQYPPPADGLSFVPVNKEAFDQAIAANPEFGTYSYLTQGAEERLGSYHRVGSLPLYVRVTLPANAYRGPWLAQTRLYGAFALIALLALFAMAGLAAQQFRQQRAAAALLEDEVALRTRELQAETAALEVLNRTGSALAAELDVDRAVQSVIDAGVELTGAQFGAFFYDDEARQPNGDGGDRRFMLYALSGASREAFAHFPMVRSTKILGPTFSDGTVIRSDDITADPRYGQNAPFLGMPEGHLPVRSYMAVPVISPTGEGQGALLFGDARPRIFTERSEHLIRGLAGQAAIALENGRLYQAAQREIEERKQAQTQQSLLIRELHHRVKNTLATVQAVVGATARSTSNIDDFYEAFVGRIISLANTHSLLTEALWQTAPLRELLEKELSPYNDEAGARIVLDGPEVELPSEAAVPIGMAIHELTTNAAKYGALSKHGGRIEVRWSAAPAPDGERLMLQWIESGGPPVTPPTRQGFGSRLLHRVLATQLNAKVETEFKPEGLRVSVDAVLKQMRMLDPSA